MDASTLALIFALGSAIYAYFRHKLSYFSSRGIPHLPALPILGNLDGPTFRRENFLDTLRRVYELDRRAKYAGVFNFMEPIILIRDTELIKSITIKDFDSFVDHRSFVDPELDPIFGKNLFNLKGDTWRKLRHVLTPAFTASKLKATFELMIPCAGNFVKLIDGLGTEARRQVDTKDLFTKYTNDIIAAFAFGIEVDSLNDPTNDFYVIGREATNLQGFLSLKILVSRAFPWLMKLLNVTLVSDETKRFFIGVVEDQVRRRRRSGVRRPDMLQLMMDANLDLINMTSNAFGFFFGGFDTTSTQMCIIAHILAIEPDVQRRLQLEIDEVLDRRADQKITYEDIQGMAYMDAVISECLRRHTQVPILDRICTKPYVLPPSLPGLEPYVVMPGDMVWMSAAGVQMDSKFYDDPERFDPDRFLDKKKGMNDVTNLSFGVGQRSCIGNRLALLEIKTVLFFILAKYDLLKTPKTCDPLVYSKSTFSLLPEGGFWLGFERRRDGVLSDSSAICDIGENFIPDGK